MGVYINHALDEPNKLLEFWKNQVSLDYKKLRDEKLLVQRAKNENWDLNIAVPSQKQAVPSPSAPSTLSRLYNQFGQAKELDVAFTVNKDLSDEGEQQKQVQFSEAKRRDERAQKQRIEQDLN